MFDPTKRTVVVTDADPATVRDAVAGPYSPPLAFIWGCSDDVRATDAGGAYEWSTLGELRSATLSWNAEPTGSGQRITFETDGTPTAYVETSVRDESDKTVLAVETSYDSRVGLNALLSLLAARGLRAAMWRAQGYEVREQDGSLL